MQINPKYIDLIGKKLDLMNKLDPRFSKTPEERQGYKMPDLMSQMGETAKRYLDSKKSNTDQGNEGTP